MTFRPQNHSVREHFRQTSPVVVLATLAVSLYLYITQWPEIGVVGDFHLHITDLLFGLIAIYCAVGAMTRWYYPVLPEVLLLILGGTLVLSFGRGALASSAAASGVQFREFTVFIFLVAFIYFWGRELNVDWVLNKIIAVGWGIAILSFARLILGLDAFILRELDPLREPRTLDSSAALMLGQATMIAVYDALSASRGAQRWYKWGTFLVFAVALLISQQRTATFATLAGVGIVVASLKRHYRAIVITSGSAALIASIIFGVGWVDVGGDSSEYLPRAVSMLLKGEGTFGWREEYWQDYFDVYSHAPVVDQLIGQPFGVPRLAVVQSRYLEYSAHNEYMQLLLNGGATGVLLYTLVLVYALTKGPLLLMSANGFSRPRHLVLAVAVVATHAVFSYGYNLPNEQGLLLAIALQAIGRTPWLSLGREIGRTQVRCQD
jgi:hypothetical protein